MKSRMDIFRLSPNMPRRTEKRLKEFYHVYPWGRVPEDLEAFTRQLYADLTAIGIELLSGLTS